MKRTTTIADFVCYLRDVLAEAQTKYLNERSEYEDYEAFEARPGGPELQAQLDWVATTSGRLAEVAEANEDWTLVNLVYDELAMSATNTWSGKRIHATFRQRKPSGPRFRRHQRRRAAPASESLQPGMRTRSRP